MTHCASRLFGGHVVAGVSPVRQHQALSHEPLVDVDLAHEAAADDPPVAIDIALVARDGAAADEILQRQGGSLTAAPLAAGSIQTGLAAFRGVDAVQPNALAVDPERVAVDH
jgi:hypothetical protein